ncbi:hypothetical protein DelCs14_3631 [Delftia sp. Cs1-4]|uniref:hypothetical protein n=1 Tax=Delftia sp. (strain Cs1-4) TaxID=742013 RepID=UPI00020E84B1|nr:hypothetical protein [Delftia sp. Cs1-4]AEF90623.1 hypothetical protein DelCs14_3631 [Delftia sp. Cs1-4]
MTIVFVTAHDPQTEANLSIARLITAPDDLNIFGEDATRANLIQILSTAAGSRPLFCMSHGSRDAVLDDVHVGALQAKDARLLESRKVFAWACHTGARLGHSVGQSGGIWWGYDCAITAPDNRVKYAKIFATIFSEIKESFAACENEESAYALIQRIRELCEAALEALDKMGAKYDEDSFSLYSCCNQIWSRLSVWLAHQTNPCRHPMAPSPFIEL